MKATLSSLLPALFLLLAMPSAPVFAGANVTNDSFASAPVYTGAVMSSFNGPATVEPGEPNHFPGNGALPFHSVWWKFTPPLSGVYKFDTIGSSFDTVMSVYTGTTVKTLVRVAADDDGGGGGTSQVLAFLTKGITYRIAVDGYDATKTGTVSLHGQLLRYFTARTYQVLVGADTGMDSGGLVTFTVATSGLVTGKFLLGARSYAFTSGLDETGAFTASVARSGGLLTAGIACTIPSAAFSIGGMSATCNSGPANCTFKIGAGTNPDLKAYPTATGDAALVPYFPTSAPYTAANPCPRAGRYPFTTNGTTETGYAVATLTVGATGVCTASGRLAEGTAFTFTAPLLDNLGGGLTGIGSKGAIFFNVPLYAAKGRLSGQSTFDAAVSPAALNGSALWLRPAPAPGTLFLPRGLVNGIILYGSLYAPVKGQRVDAAFNANNGAMTFIAARAGYPNVTQTVMLSPANLFTYGASNPNLVKLSLNVATGMVTGSVKFTGAPAATAVSAVLVHNASAGPPRFLGYTPGTTGYGNVSITP